MAEHPYGASIKLDGAPVRLFLDKVYPEVPGEYGYMPVRAIGHYNMAAAVRAGQAPRCTWNRDGRTVAFDVLAIPRPGVLRIGNIAIA